MSGRAVSLRGIRLLVCLALLMQVSLPVYCAEFWEGELRYSTDGNTATVLPLKTTSTHSPSGDHYLFTEIEIPKTVTYNGQQIPVTKIERYAFEFCATLTKVKLPETITVIGESAFIGATALPEINLPSGLEEIQSAAFSGCKSLTSITIPSRVKEIGSMAFYYCSSLATVTIEEGVGKIGNQAFYYCTNLQTVNIPSSVTSIGDRAFERCTSLTSIEIPASVEEMGTRVFYECTSLAEVILPQSGWGQIMDYTFYNCTALTDITIPSGVVRIGQYAFYNTAIDIEIPTSVERIEKWAFRESPNMTKELNLPNIQEIGEYAFYGCNKIPSVIFGNKLKRIDKGAFSSCSNITKVDIGDLANWCEVEFVFGETSVKPYSAVTSSSNPLVYAKKIYLNGKELNSLNIPAGVTKISGNNFNGCSRFMSVVIPNTVTSIGDYAFYDCSDLSSVTFPANCPIDSIGDYAFANNPCLMKMSLPANLKYIGAAFYNCQNLESVNLPEGITTIADKTFYQCYKLNGITIPEGVTRIGTQAFWSCTSLESINIPSAVKSIGTNAFQKCSGMTGVYITDLAAWCAIKHADPYTGSGSGMAWQPTAGEGSPLILAHNLYLNGELITGLVIPGSIETVEDYAFWGATCLKSITLEEGVTTLGKRAFADCTLVDEIRIPKSLTTVASNSNNTTFYFYYARTQPTSIYIEDIESWINNNIGSGFVIFGYVSGRTYAFDLYLNDKLVTDLVIPESITQIPSETFPFIYSIKTATLPTTCESIAEAAFPYCENLTTIYSKSMFAPDGTGVKSSYNKSLSRIYVPAGSGTNYKLKWTNNADIIFEAPAAMTFTDTQTADELTEAKAAYCAINDTEITCVDLSGATLDESVTSESLKTGDTNSNMVYYLPSGTTSVTGSNIVVDGKATNIVLEDCQPFGVSTEFTAESILYSRTQGVDDTWATMCLPFSCEIPDGITVEEFDRLDGNKAIFKPATSIEAGKPYLFKAGAGTTEVVMQATDATVKSMADFENVTAEFIGVLSERITFDSDFREPGCKYYGVNAAANEFQLLGEKATCAPFRAYLKVSESQSAQAKAYSLVHGGDTPTGITERNCADNVVKTVYNINGQRLEKPRKGLNIINGKKVIIK